VSLFAQRLACPECGGPGRGATFIVTQPIITRVRKTGLRVLGDVPWGQHVALFYDTKEDLLEICGSFLKAGLEEQRGMRVGDRRAAHRAGGVVALRDTIPVSFVKTSSDSLGRASEILGHDAGPGWR